jgi:hypothetical protein
MHLYESLPVNKMPLSGGGDGTRNLSLTCSL